MATVIIGLPGWCSSEEQPPSVGDTRDSGSISGSGRFPWSRKWQPTSVFLPGKFNGQRNIGWYSPWGHKESDRTEHVHTHTCTHTVIIIIPSYRSANKQRHRELTWLAQGLMVNGRSKSNTTNLIPDPSLNYQALEAFLFFSIQLMLIRPRGEIPWWASG